MKFIPTTPADLEKLKGRAKALKRKHNLKHRDALERAAKEAGYQHWHHAVRCQERSEASAKQLSMSFLCESMRRDALKGETHYISEAEPFPFVLLANGQKDGLLLDLIGQRVLVLAERGEPRAFEVDDVEEHIGWHGQWSADEQDRIEVREGSRVWHVQIDGDAYDDALERVADLRDGGGVHVHDPEDPESAALMRAVLGGEGLEPITAEIAQALVTSGYQRQAVEEAIAAGARYSRQRNSIFYPPEVG